MAFYSVHLRGDGPQSVAEAAFVRQAFSWKAFFFGPVWLLRHRLWAGLALWAAGYSILITASLTAASTGAGLFITLALQMLLGLEANRLREAKLAPTRVSSRRNHQCPGPRRSGSRFLPPNRSAGPSARGYRVGGAPVREGVAVNVAIVDYGSGNLHSVRKAFERAAREAGVSGTINVTRDPDDVFRADRIVLPGVGAFADCRRGLDAVPGMVAAMIGAVCEKARPFLGICVGMQLLATRGLEYQTTPGLGWIGGDVEPIDSQGGRLRIPHMGWNTLQTASVHPLLAGIPAGEEGMHAYFVHSYAFRPSRQDCVIAVTNYGGPIAALIGRDNIAGTQFHPEKSQALGLALIANFLRWRP